MLLPSSFTDKSGQERVNLILKNHLLDLRIESGLGIPLTKELLCDIITSPHCVSKQIINLFETYKMHTNESEDLIQT